MHRDVDFTNLISMDFGIHFVEMLLDHPDILNIENESVTSSLSCKRISIISVEKKMLTRINLK